MGTGTSKLKNGAKRKSISSFAEKDVAELVSTSPNGDTATATAAKDASSRRFSAPAAVSPVKSSPLEKKENEKEKKDGIPVPASPTPITTKHLGSPPPFAVTPDDDTEQDADNENENEQETEQENENDSDNHKDSDSDENLVPSSPTASNPILSSSGSFTNSSSPIVLKEKHDLDSIISRLLESRNRKVSNKLPIKNNEINSILNAARNVFLSQPILLELLPPVNIVGDIHGQYSDLLRIFDLCGYPPTSNYLFLGDYVDRGKQSLETILLLLCFKIKYPENFFILRGNHECASVNRVYGFYDECKRRTNMKIWKAFTDVFNCLPVAALVAGKIFCVHGGLSPSLHSMDDIRAITRPSDVPDFGLLNDLLWSDPSDLCTTWEDNERGVSYCFSKQIVSEFLQKHDLDLVCRAHMVVEEGYEFFNNRTLVTVFSAPNYCGEFDNKGAIMCVNEDLLCSFEILQPITHPRHRFDKKGRRLSPPLIGGAGSKG